LAGYMKIVTRVLIDAYPNRIMNIHPSLLPSFPGLKAQQQALDWGVKVSGCTVHFVTEGVDTGPIIRQAAVPVQENDTAETLGAHDVRNVGVGSSNPLTSTKPSAAYRSSLFVTREMQPSPLAV